VFEPRAVASCSACTSEEYCHSESTTHRCHLLPPQCEASASCECFQQVSRRLASLACSEENGRIETRASVRAFDVGPLGEQ
jgi:hypothetical protein